MREIKFRAWFKDAMAGQVCSQQEERTLLKFLNDLENAKKDHGWDYILMQYTGLKDNNGKEIYEGDIINHPYKGINEVYWDEGSAEYTTYPYERMADGGKVIGNIYENPELLGKE